MSNIIEKINQEQLKKEVTAFTVGDSVKVHTRVVEGDKERIQIFAGIVIARKGYGINEAFTGRGLKPNVVLTAAVDFRRLATSDARHRFGARSVDGLVRSATRTVRLAARSRHLSPRPMRRRRSRLLRLDPRINRRLART